MFFVQVVPVRRSILPHTNTMHCLSHFPGIRSYKLSALDHIIVTSIHLPITQSTQAGLEYSHLTYLKLQQQATKPLPNHTSINMTYTIYASICQHPIRQSSTLPWSGSPLDFDVRYCSDLCARGLPTRNEHRAAESAYTSSRSRLDRGSISRAEHRPTQRRFDRSRAALEQYNYDLNERDENSRRARGERTLRDRGRSFAGLDDPAWTAFQRQMNPRHGQRATIEDSDRHRRESQYRDQADYRRASRHYEPGRYADTSGSGFYDTSGRNRRDPPAPSLTRSSTTGRRGTAFAPSSSRSYAPSTSRRRSSTRSDAYLDELDDDALEARRRQVERYLSRYN